MRTSSTLLLVAASLTTFACGPRDSDKLKDSDLNGAATATRASDSGRCTARSTQDEIRRQLFARAAEIRGANGDDYARIAEFAVLQLDGAAPVDSTSAGALADCRGHATLRLPAGLKVAGGRTTLGGDISYSVASGGRGAVTLGQSDPIAIPLATLTQNRAPAPAPSPRPAVEPSVPAAPVPEPRDVNAPPMDEPPEPAPPPAEANSAARPSFNCRRARTFGERAVCDSPALAALDRGMAMQYRSAMANGGPEERRLLVETRDRFLAYRDRCTSDACVAGSYRGRMREIDDIVAGRWRGPR